MQDVVLFLLDTIELGVSPCISRYISVIHVTDEVKFCTVVVLSAVKLYMPGRACTYCIVSKTHQCQLDCAV